MENVMDKGLKKSTVRKIIVIAGSPIKKSHTDFIAKIAFEYAKKKYGKDNVDLLDLSLTPLEPFRGFKENYNKFTKETIESMDKYDVFVICTPIYNGMLSSAVKNIFEHADYKEFEGKVAGFITMSSSYKSTYAVQAELNILMNYFDIVSNPRAVFIIEEDFTEDKEAEKKGEFKLKNEKIIERINTLVDSSVKLASGAEKAD